MERCGPKAVRISPASLAYLKRETRASLSQADYGNYIVVSGYLPAPLSKYDIYDSETFHGYYEFVYFQEPDFFVEVRRKV